MSQHDRPIHEIRLGRIRASIWANQSQRNGNWYSVSIVRTYREEEVWKDSSSFSRDDLPVVVKAAEMAYAWIWTQRTGQNGVRND